MQYLVMIVGLLFSGLALLVLCQPRRLPLWLGGALRGARLYGIALLRLLLGAGLIAAAPDTSLPLAVSAVGWLLVLTALILVVIPAPTARRVGQRFAAGPPWRTRLCMLGPLALGLLLLVASR